MMVRHRGRAEYVKNYQSGPLGPTDFGIYYPPVAPPPTTHPTPPLNFPMEGHGTCLQDGSMAFYVKTILVSEQNILSLIRILIREKQGQRDVQVRTALYCKEPLAGQARMGTQPPPPPP